MRGPHLIGTDTGSATGMEVGGGGEGWELVTSPLSPVSAWSRRLGADPFSCLAQFVNLGRKGLGTVQVFFSPTLKLFYFTGFVYLTLF